MSLADYINEKPVLKTERLTLRTLIPSDADDLREWTPNKALYKYWGKNPGKTDKNPEMLFLTPEKPKKAFTGASSGIAMTRSSASCGSTSLKTTAWRRLLSVCPKPCMDRGMALKPYGRLPVLL